MNKIIGFAFVPAICLAIYLVQSQLRSSGPLGKSTNQNLVPTAPLPLDDEAANYRLSIIARQARAGSLDSTLLSISGVLNQQKQSSHEFVSRWQDISELILADAVISTPDFRSMLNQPLVSQIGSKQVTHLIGEEFPKEFYRVQWAILQKIFIATVPPAGERIEREEEDDLGAYTVVYTAKTQGDHLLVSRAWQAYKRSDIVIDPTQNILNYLVNKEGRILGITGSLKLDLKRAETKSQISIQVSMQHVGNVPASPAKVSVETLKIADFARVHEVTLQLEAARGLSYPQALEKLDAITELSDAREIYRVFSTIKSSVRGDSKLVDELVSKINASQQRDPATRRQLTVLFGALAQSDQNEVPDKLVQLAEQCPDNFCKVQAIVALHDHSKSTQAAARRMLTLAETAGDQEVAATAVLAAGTIARKLSHGQSDLSERILRLYQDPSQEAIRTSVVAAMGNDGNAIYLPALKQSLASKDFAQRAAAAYSLRHIVGEAANKALVEVVESEANLLVLREAMKAMAIRDMNAKDYAAIVHKVTSYDESLQKDAARYLIDAYRLDHKEVAESLETLKQTSRFLAVKSYIESEMKAADGLGKTIQ